ncbi:MAG TPA: Maf family protein [Candidatus Paceibacterota bacterium]|nr:Maf family protein [Candidatus Paceibacterota bacterium]
MKIILGSQSAGRRAVLSKMGYVFETISPDIDEKQIRFDDPKTLTLALAHAKADALLPRVPEPALLITSDQVVHYEGGIREKPETLEEARMFLKSYADHPATTVTAVVVANTVTGRRAEGVDIARTYFKPIPDAVIEQAIEDGKVLRCCGGFAIDEPNLAPYIDHIDGDPDSVTGLPTELVKRLLSEVEKV